MSDNEELSEFMQDYNDDCQATITAGQLQHLVNEKNAAQASIQELEAQVERLRCALFELSLALDEHQNPDDGVASDAREALSETPAQSLEAVKREALNEFVKYCESKSLESGQGAYEVEDFQRAMACADGYIANNYDDQPAQ